VSQLCPYSSLPVHLHSQPSNSTWLLPFVGNIVPVNSIPARPFPESYHIPCKPIIPSGWPSLFLTLFPNFQTRPDALPAPSTRSPLVGPTATVLKVIFFCRTYFTVMNPVMPSRPV